MKNAPTLYAFGSGMGAAERHRDAAGRHQEAPTGHPVPDCIAPAPQPVSTRFLSAPTEAMIHAGAKVLACHPGLVIEELVLLVWEAMALHAERGE